MDLKDLPLSVQVSEALGWVDIVKDGEFYRGRNPKYPASKDADGRWRLQSYETAWCASGPLVSRYKLSVEYLGSGNWVANWASEADPLEVVLMEEGVTPTEAISRLVVTMGRNGKLEGEQ